MVHAAAHTERMSERDRERRETVSRGERGRVYVAIGHRMITQRAHTRARERRETVSRGERESRRERERERERETMVCVAI